MARLWTDRHGHTFIRESATSKCLSLDRLTAYAWGILDDLYQNVELHHIDEVPWHTAEGNLIPLTTRQHFLVTVKGMTVEEVLDL